MSKTILIDGALARSQVSVTELIAVMREVMVQASNGEIVNMPRTGVRRENGNIFSVMPAVMGPAGVGGGKMIIFPGPAAGKAGTCQGIIPLFDLETGRLLAIVDGLSLTVSRTAALSAAATDTLARKDAEVLAILGTGRQGIAHALAICTVRNIRRIQLWSIPAESALAAKEELEKSVSAEVVCMPAASAAAAGADIICTTSAAREPILYGADLAEGVHVNAVGCCAPIFREIDTTVLTRSTVFVDTMDTAMSSAGDLLLPIQAGEYSKEQIAGELGQVFAGQIPGRTGQEQITLFETCGVSAQDVAAAWTVYQKVRDKGLGIEVEF